MRDAAVNDITLDGLRAVIAVAMDRDVPPLKPELDIYQDLGMDSIGAVAMVVEIQRRYNVRIPEEEVPHLSTSKLIQYVNDAMHQTCEPEK
jgi:acyl carrier protein